MGLINEIDHFSSHPSSPHLVQPAPQFKSTATIQINVVSVKLLASLLLVIFYVYSTGSLIKKTPAVSIVFYVGTQFQKSDAFLQYLLGLSEQLSDLFVTSGVATRPIFGPEVPACARRSAAVLTSQQERRWKRCWWSCLVCSAGGVYLNGYFWSSPSRALWPSHRQRWCVSSKGTYVRRGFSVIFVR